MRALSACRKARFFTVIEVSSRDISTFFTVKSRRRRFRETRFTAEAGGGLNFFVNDARGMFFNNTGVATITITLAEQD